MRTTAEENEKNNRIILAAATKCFLEKGFDATSLNDVAAEAGISRGPLYYRYKTKMYLYLAVCKSYLDSGVHEYERIFRQDKPIIEILHDDLDFCSSSHEGFNWLVLHDAGTHPEVKQLFDQAYDRIYQVKYSAVKAAIARGEMHKDTDAGHIVDLLFVFMDGLYQKFKDNEDRENDFEKEKNCLIEDLLFIIEKKYCT